VPDADSRPLRRTSSRHLSGWGRRWAIGPGCVRQGVPATHAVHHGRISGAFAPRAALLCIDEYDSCPVAGLHHTLSIFGDARAACCGYLPPPGHRLDQAYGWNTTERTRARLR
jgi:hypothetical protein